MLRDFKSRICALIKYSTSAVGSLGTSGMGFFFDWLMQNCMHFVSNHRLLTLHSLID